MSLEPAADGEDGPLQLGRDVLGDVVVGACPVVEAFGPRFQIAASPAMEPGLAAAQRRANVLDRLTSEAQTNGTLACRKFVVHSVLRGAAADGCPRAW